MPAISVNSPDRTTRVFTNDDGSTVTHSGGTQAWRNNNPGNIRSGNFATNHGAIGEASGFAVFPNTQTGENALRSLLNTNNYRNSTLDAMTARYAPPNENNTQVYQNDLSTRVGVDGDTRISDLTPEQLNNLVHAIERHEGNMAGTVTHSPANNPQPTIGGGSSMLLSPSPGLESIAARLQNSGMMGQQQVMAQIDEKAVMENLRQMMQQSDKVAGNASKLIPPNIRNVVAASKEI